VRVRSATLAASRSRPCCHAPAEKQTAPRFPATVRVAGSSSPSPTRQPSSASSMRGIASSARPARQRSTPAAWRAAISCAASRAWREPRRVRVHSGIRRPPPRCTRSRPEPRRNAGGPRGTFLGPVGRCDRRSTKPSAAACPILAGRGGSEPSGPAFCPFGVSGGSRLRRNAYTACSRRQLACDAWAQVPPSGRGSGAAHRRPVRGGRARGRVAQPTVDEVDERLVASTLLRLDELGL
jgi:hypothetical protein